MNSKTFLYAVYILFVITISLNLNGCSDKTDDPPVEVTKELTKVMGENNNWYIVGQLSTTNKSDKGVHFYQIEDGGFSINPSNQLNFLFSETIEKMDVTNTDYFVGHLDMITMEQFIEPHSGRQAGKNYFFNPDGGELLESGDGTINSSSINYQNSHALASSYTNGRSDIDVNGNIITSSVNKGAQQWLFIRRDGTTEDSLYTATASNGVYSGFYPAVLKNGQLYAIAKNGKSVVAFKQDASTYASGKGELKLIDNIACSSFFDEINAKYQASVSKDGRYIYYWLCETFFKPTRGWYFELDVENETFTQVLDFVSLGKGVELSTTGKSRFATIGDDGALFITGNDDPDDSGRVTKIYRMDVAPTAKVAVEYKPENFLLQDKSGKAYQINFLRNLNGKLVVGVPSGNVGEDPQLDIIMEK